MGITKPNIQSYFSSWFFDQFRLELDVQPKNNYESQIQKLKKDFENCELWKELNIKLQKDYNDEYRIKNNEHRLVKKEFFPELCCKPYDSLINKSFRKNIVENESFPEPPKDGWVEPNKWFIQIKDLLRTTIIVRYLDGVEFVVNKIRDLADTYNFICSVDYEARDVGYYAAHITVAKDFTIQNINETETDILFSVEIQVSTELQEAIKQLTHELYEQRRSLTGVEKEKKWQWNNQSLEFKSYYLGHILHYLDGMLVEARNIQNQNKTK